MKKIVNMKRFFTATVAAVVLVLSSTIDFVAGFILVTPSFTSSKLTTQSSSSLLTDKKIAQEDIIKQKYAPITTKPHQRLFATSSKGNDTQHEQQLSTTAGGASATSYDPSDAFTSDDDYSDLTIIDGVFKIANKKIISNSNGGVTTEKAVSDQFITDMFEHAAEKPQLSTSLSSANDDSKNDAKFISKYKLLSSIVHAALLGSQAIQSLNGSTDSADAVISSLQKKYPPLKIVSQKSNGQNGSQVQVNDSQANKKDTVVHTWNDLNEELVHSFQFYAPPDEEVKETFFHGSSEELNVNHLVVYIDPSMDGAVPELSIGVCYKGRPIMGAIALPSPSNTNSGDEKQGTNDDVVEVVYGMVGKGIGKACGSGGNENEGITSSCLLAELEPYKSGEDMVKVSSGGSPNVSPAINLAQKLFPSMEHDIVEGCGNKLLNAALGKTTLSVQHGKTSSWDTAAGTAILTSLGGMVTDYFGDDLVYDKQLLNNELGVVASTPGAKSEHLKLVQAMRGDRECLSILEKYGLRNDVDHAQCVDIVRDLNGRPLSVQYFAEKLGVDNAVTYSCPESDDFRGLMSNACRVILSPGGETAFYKRIVFSHLEHALEKMKTAPHKVKRDAKSYQVVTSFLSSKAYHDVMEKAGVHIPKCYDAQLEPDTSNPFDSKFTFLLEDFAPWDGWYQEWLLDGTEECEAALTTLAKIHAFFWEGSNFWNDAEAGAELESAIWKSGSYVQPKAQNINQCKNVAKGWATERFKIEKELSSFDYWDNLGKRLESVAEECGQLAHPFAYDDSLSKSYKKYRTFTHGDPKQANLFFRRPSSDSSDSLGDDGDQLEVGLIDFQWSGFGLAATDIAHHLTAGVHADMLVDGGEEKLLRYYFGELQKYLVEFGAYSTKDEALEEYSYNTFLDQYETGVLDVCRLVIAYAWSRWECVERDDEEGCARTFNKTSYNKSVETVVWLLSRCDEIMKSRGV